MPKPDKIEITEEEFEDIKEMVSIMLGLTKEERLFLYSNANAFKALQEMNKSKEETTV